MLNFSKSNFGSSATNFDTSGTLLATVVTASRVASWTLATVSRIWAVVSSALAVKVEVMVYSHQLVFGWYVKHDHPTNFGAPRTGRPPPSAGDVLAPEPEHRQRGEQHRVGQADEAAADHVVPPDRIHQRAGPGERIVRRQPVPEVTEGVDLVEDLGQDRDQHRAADGTQRGIGHDTQQQG